jgi:hypothetical protein
MKRITIFSIIIISIIISLTYTSRAQNEPTCPEGYSIKEVVLQADCYYKVKICYYCGCTINPIGSMAILSIKKFGISDPPCDYMTLEERLQAFHSQMMKPDFMEHYLGCSPLGTVPPCGNTPIASNFLLQYTCWNKIKDTDGGIIFEVCPWGSSRCVVEYVFCWDSLIGAHSIIVDHYIFGSYSCPLGPEPPDPQNVGQFSVCFGVSTLCNQL